MIKNHYLTKSEFDNIDHNIEIIDGKYIVKNVGTFYYKNGLAHREYGAAKEFLTGTYYWYVNGKLHRLDGPAVKYSDGNIQYWINSKLYSSKEEYEIAVYLYKNNLEIYQ